MLENESYSFPNWDTFFQLIDDETALHFFSVPRGELTAIIITDDSDTFTGLKLHRTKLHSGIYVAPGR